MGCLSAHIDRVIPGTTVPGTITWLAWQQGSRFIVSLFVIWLFRWFGKVGFLAHKNSLLKYIRVSMSNGLDPAPRWCYSLFFKEQDVVVCKQEAAFMNANLGERAIHCTCRALAIPGKEVLEFHVEIFSFRKYISYLWQ